VNKVGAGIFMAVTVSSALIAYIVVDHFGWFRMNIHAVSPLRVLGGALLIGGVSLVTKF
jgi:transporter family-2 protein